MTAHAKQPNPDQLMGRKYINVSVSRELKAVRAAVTRKKLWFIDIPRTSSTFVHINLGDTVGFPYGKIDNPGEKYYNRSKVSPLFEAHMPAYVAQEILGQTLWDQLNSFTVVREPLSWAISYWQFFLRFQPQIFGDGEKSFFRLVRMLSNGYRPALNQRDVHPAKYSPADYVVDSQGGNVIVKTLLKYEDRTKIKEFLMDLTGGDLPHDRPMASANMGQYEASKEEKALVYKVFEREYDLFGY